MPEPATPETSAPKAARITSIDALRGFVMFTMIFVNDLAGAGKFVPDWMVHFSERHKTGSGMTFVDLVFPAFLFIVGMSVPQALGRRLAAGGSMVWTLGHVAGRTLALLAIGILMVHETPDSEALGWPGDWWCTLMYLSSMAAFCSIEPGWLELGRAGGDGGEPRSNAWRVASRCARVTGMAGMLLLALAFRGSHGRRILTIAPFSLDTEWYGILGLIGWAYLVACLVYLAFRAQRTAILGCMGLLMCLFAAERTRMFDGFFVNRIVGIGGALGSQGAIATGGLLLGAMLTDSQMAHWRARGRFTWWFVLGCSAAALLLNGLYGISKNQATPSWCFWSCAITAALWYLFYLVADVRPVAFVSGPLAAAGRNVLLAYLISEMLPGLLEALGLGRAYDHLASSCLTAVARSAACGVVILAVATGLNRLGLRLRL